MLNTVAAVNVLRQPHSPPIQAPSGAAHTVATDTPVSTTDIARANWCSGHQAHRQRRGHRPEAAQRQSQQHPRGQQQGSVDAVAARMLETSSRAVSARSTTLRSKRCVANGMVGAAMAPTMAVAVTAWPPRRR
jgi:hypothetical protein